MRTKLRELYNTLLGLKRLIGLTFNAGYILPIFLIGFTILSGITPSIEIWLFGNLVDSIEHAINADLSEKVTILLYWIFLIASIRVLEAIFIQWANLLNVRVQEEVKTSIKTEFFRKVSKVSFAHYENNDFYDLLSRAKNGVDDYFPGLFFQLISTFKVLITLCGLAYLTWKVHWLIPTIIILASVPTSVVQTIYNDARYNLAREQTAQHRSAGYLVGLLTSRSAAKEIRVLGIAPYLVRRWQARTEQLRFKFYRQGLKQRINMAKVQSLTGLAFFMSIFVFIRSIEGGNFGVGDSVVVIYSVLLLHSQAEWFIRYLGWIQEDYKRCLVDVLGFLDLPEEYEASLGNQTNKENNRQNNYYSHILIENVSFAYPGCEKLVLQDINLELKRGEKLALVGINGSGKTTLIKLILGFYKPLRGRILFNGIDINSNENQNIKSQLSAVFQDFVRYQLTVQDNIGFGDIENKENVSAIQIAAKKGGANELIESLSKGYHTMLGSAFGGCEISGGQWQRLAVSRGFMGSFDLLILDEPTASLDPSAETELYEQILIEAGSSTSILISHRIGFARLADRIVVLKDGKIEEVGNHEKLIQNTGEYWRLYNTQAKLYSGNIGS